MIIPMPSAKSQNRISVIASDLLVSALLKRIIINNIRNCSVKVFNSFSKLKEDQLDYGIILIDGQVAGSSGSEIIDYLRFTRKNLSRIIFLGYSDYDRNKALLLGANHVISKPIPIGQLIEMIKTNLN
jgi:DNA-binding response OmpR family regulator